MDIFFTDPSDIPLPPDEVHIRQLIAEPWSDGRRVRVYLEITPFQKRPNGEISIIKQPGVEVASVSIIETIDPKMEITLHLRDPETAGEYFVQAIIFYSEQLEEGEENKQVEFEPRNKIIVDRAEASFSITKKAD